MDKQSGAIEIVSADVKYDTSMQFVTAFFIH